MSTPEQLADFEVIRRLGAGGMAEVFLAKKRGAEGTYKLLVVKRVLPSHGASRRFRSMFVEEAHLATRLNHPNIVQVYEFSDHGDDGLLLSMEYVEGLDLGKLMSTAKRRDARIPPYVSAYVASEAAKGLHYAHERRDEGGLPLAIVHRDVSPQNVLLSHEGIVKIADFGIASANLFREEPGVLKGKTRYMSPEQARGEKVDRRSDIYALGVVLYEMLTLRSPYGELEGDALLEAVRTGAFQRPSALQPDIPTEVEAIVLRAMSLVADDRFQSARDMAGAIARVLLAKQELVDAATIEATLVHIVGRDPRGAIDESGDVLSQPQTLAAVPIPRGTASGSSVGTGARTPAPRVVQEVRHVAIVTLRIEGLEEVASGPGKVAAQRSAASIRATLDDIAYKRGAIWSWDGNFAARAILGLVANPSRAAADAASLAIDVHEALSGASEDLPVTMRAAIGLVRGIASGERDEQGHLAHHTLQEPAHFLAEQVGTQTPFGKTWVAGGIYRLVRRDFRWGDAPTIDLEGADDRPIPQQMRLYELERPLTREERMAEMALAPNDLVGRNAEKADLFTAYYRAVSPRASTSSPPLASMPPSSRAASGELIARALVGEMGIGKTALCATFLQELPSETRVLHVECSPVKIELPFATTCDLLREATGIGVDASVEQAAEAIEAQLGGRGRAPNSIRLAARLAEVVTGKQSGGAVDEDAANYRRDLVIAGVRYLFGAIASKQPLVVVVDGLQWADLASLDLLKEVLRRADRAPILILLVTRPEERVMPFLDGIVRIELGGLHPDEQIRLIEARLGVREGVAAVCRELVPRVAGNPFFLLEMVDALLERGTLEIVESDDGKTELVRHDRAGGERESLPSTLEQLIGDRLRELPAVEHDIVAWLSVAGGPLPVADLLRLAGLPDDDAVTRLCARGLCDRKGDALDLRHPLARDVAYLGLDAAARARRHRLIGEHLATTPLAHGLSAAIVARHLARGEAPLAAAELYLRAAVAARSAHQAQLAHRYFQRVLTLLPANDTRRMVAHEALEAIYRHLGRRRERRQQLAALRDLARQSAQAKWVALALVRTARLDLDEGHLARGLPIAQRAAEIAKMAKLAALEVEAQTVLSEILPDLGDIQGAIRACERALAVAASGNLSPRSRAEVLRSKGVLLRRVGRVQEAVEAHVEAIAVFRAVGARRSEARARNSLAFAMFVLERFEDAIALGLSSIGIDLAIGGRFQIAKTLSNIGQAYARLGDRVRGLAYLKRARDSHERYADQDSWADTLLSTAGLLIESGDVDAAHTLAGDAGALVAATGSVYDAIHERITRALLARAAGDPAGAIAFTLEARKLAEEQALVSYHLYATAIEAAARIDAGETHTGVLLATTALGAIEASAGSEYGVEVRALCAEALVRGAPQSCRDPVARAAAHVRKVASHVRDPRLRALFLARPVVTRIFGYAADLGIEKPDSMPASPRLGSG